MRTLYGLTAEQRIAARYVPIESVTFDGKGSRMTTHNDHDLTISREDLARIAPAVLDTLREMVGYGLCRQANTAERKSLSEHYAKMAHKALRDFPSLKLNYANSKTIVTDTKAPELAERLKRMTTALSTAASYIARDTDKGIADAFESEANEARALLAEIEGANP